MCILNAACSLFLQPWTQLFHSATLSFGNNHTHLLLCSSVISHLCYTCSHHRKPLLSSQFLPVCNFPFMRDLPALNLRLIICCQPCLLPTHSSWWFPDKRVILLSLIKRLVFVPHGFWYAVLVAVWHSPTSTFSYVFAACWTICLKNSCAIHFSKLFCEFSCFTVGWIILTCPLLEEVVSYMLV